MRARNGLRVGPGSGRREAWPGLRRWRGAKGGTAAWVGDRGRGRHALPVRQEREGIDIGPATVEEAYAEGKVRLAQARPAGGPDCAQSLATVHVLPAPHRDRAEVEVCRQVAAARDAHRPAGGAGGAREAHAPTARRAHRGAGWGADADSAPLAGSEGVGPVAKAAQHGAAHRPAPPRGGPGRRGCEQRAEKAGEQESGGGHAATVRARPAAARARASLFTKS